MNAGASKADTPTPAASGLTGHAEILQDILDVEYGIIAEEPMRFSMERAALTAAIEALAAQPAPGAGGVSEKYDERFWQVGVCASANIVTYDGEDVHGIGNATDPEHVCRKHNEIVRALLSTRHAESVAQGGEDELPVAWSLCGFIHDDDGTPIGTDEPRVIWGAECPDETEGWSPLYAGPTPATGSGGESAKINPAQGAFDGTACRMAAQIGVAYNSNEKCQLGAPFYAFSVTELVTFARAIAALPHPAPAGGGAGDADHG